MSLAPSCQLVVVGGGTQTTSRPRGQRYCDQGLTGSIVLDHQEGRPNLAAGALKSAPKAKDITQDEEGIGEICSCCYNVGLANVVSPRNGAATLISTLCSVTSLFHTLANVWTPFNPLMLISVEHATRPRTFLTIPILSASVATLSFDVGVHRPRRAPTTPPSPRKGSRQLNGVDDSACHRLGFASRILKVPKQIALHRA